MRIKVHLAGLVLLSGCANPEVVQISPGTYMLARADHGGIFGNKDALKAGVLKDASEFAERQKQVAIPVAAKEHPIGVMGDWASYEFTFRLASPESQDAKVNWVLVKTESDSTGGVTSMGTKDTYYIAKPASQLQNATQAPAPVVPTRSERLAELKRLLDSGLISRDEYESKRKAVLSEI
jgi:hypothetical protein